MWFVTSKKHMLLTFGLQLWSKVMVFFHQSSFRLLASSTGMAYNARALMQATPA
jgi:hypothetical protein